MEQKEKKKKENVWISLATFIVDKRKAIEILFIFAIIYSVLSVNKVQVNQDITSYLPAQSETRRGLNVMSEEFLTYGMARVMVSNITYEEADLLVDRIEQVKGVKEVAFDGTKEHYIGADALFDVTVDGEDEDPASIAAIKGIKEELSEYDVYVSTTVGAVEESAEVLSREMSTILVLAVIIIVGVLLLSTKAYLEIPVLLLTFGVAALLNMGTNYWFGEISFVTNAAGNILQLAVSLDYSVFLIHRFQECRMTVYGGA